MSGLTSWELEDARDPIDMQMIADAYNKMKSHGIGNFWLPAAGAKNALYNYGQNSHITYCR